MNKRLRASILSVLVVIFSVFPAKRSEAVVPLAIGLTMQAFGVGGTVINSTMLTAGVTALIGGTILALAMSPTEMGDGSANVPIRIPLTTAPESAAAIPFPTPPPSASAYGGDTVPSGQGWIDDYGTDYFSTMWGAATGGLFSEYPGELALTPTVIGQVMPYECAQISETEATCLTLEKINEWEFENADRLWLTYEGDPVCPSGYELNDGTSTSGCTLVDPTAVSSDFLADFRRNGQQYTFTDADTLPAYASNPNGNVGVYGTDTQGRPTYVHVTPTADGGSNVGIYTQVGDSVQGQTIAVAPNGAVTSVSDVTAVGTVSAPTVANTPAAVTGVATGATTGTGAVTEPGSIVFPSDYARAGEAANAANTVKSSIDIVAAKMTNTENVNDPTAPDYVDPWASTFGTLKGWSLPGHSSTCPVGSFNWNGQLFLIDAHCQLVADHFGVLQVVMSVVWVVLALWVVLGA